MTEYKNYEARAIQDIANSNFQFSTAMQDNLATDGNLVFSPLSLGVVLLMARFGARGRTATQIDTALKFPYPVDSKDDLLPFRLGFFKMLEKIKNNPSQFYNVTLATRMYLDEGFKIDKTFRNISKMTLDIHVRHVNFANGVNASETINSWVRNETDGKITELFSPGSFSSNTKMVLVNAIYFKSPWKYPFEAQKTQKSQFILTDGQKTEVDMMIREDKFPSGDLQQLNAKIVVLPYKGDRFSMHVLIPKEKQTLNGLLLALKSINMDAIRKNIRNADNCNKVRLHLPKFKIESTHDLVQPLKKMGITDMFSETQADFGGIPRHETEAPKLFVSQVMQKAYIAVDEKGTEASAATGVRVDVSCKPRVTEIKADQPFYYQIVEDDTGAVLFAGVVRVPSAPGHVEASGASKENLNGMSGEDDY